MCVVCAIAAVLAGIAWPTWRDHLLHARRADGVQALARVQAAQESYRSHHGLYATELAVLEGATQARSAEGYYAVQLERTAAEAYRATAVAQGGQARDADCAVLTLKVRQGFATHGPGTRCWNR
jgi:type IV pilus assembly protein PilE